MALLTRTTAARGRLGEAYVDAAVVSCVRSVLGPDGRERRDTRNLRCACMSFTPPCEEDFTDAAEFVADHHRAVMRSMLTPTLTVAAPDAGVDREPDLSCA